METMLASPAGGGKARGVTFGGAGGFSLEEGGVSSHEPQLVYIFVVGLLF